MPTLLLTKTSVEKLAFTKTGVVLYYDTRLKGFGVRVSKSIKTYFAENRVHGKTRRVKIGTHGKDLSTELGRDKALKCLSLMNDGVDPNAEKMKTKSRNKITLKKAFEDYIEARKDLKPKTIYDYQKIIANCFGDWESRSLLDIGGELVAKKHVRLAEGHGRAYANLAMRVLRAIFNFAIAQYPDMVFSNPVKRLSDTRSWYKVSRRRTVIKPHDLKGLFDSLDQMEESSSVSKAGVVRDYTLLLLFTGLRRQEGAQLKWDDIDFKARTLNLKDTKNREPHTLPLSDFLLDLFKNRLKHRVPENPFVFPGNGLKTQYLVEPSKQLNKVRQVSGVQFSIHDLRRTFLSVAESLDIPYYALKKLVNHRLSDVTAGYIVSDVERLRKPMQLITDKILMEAGRFQPAKIINLRKG